MSTNDIVSQGCYHGKDGHALGPKVSGTEFVQEKEEAIHIDRKMESDLTLKQLFRQHPAIVWWSLYWAVSAVGWGFDSQINGGMISIMAFRRDFGYVENGVAILPADWQTAFNVIVSVGLFIGGFICSYTSDLIGRKKSLAIGLIITTGGIFGELFSSDNVPFVIAKLILGVGLGFFLTLAPLATSEIAPVVFRGISTASVNLGLVVGQLISNAVIKAFSDRADHWAYRGPFAIQFFFILILAIGLPFMPETPWYLCRNGQRDAARKSLLKLYGPNIDVEGKLAAIDETIAAEEGSEKGTWLQCFQGTNRIRTIISMGLFCCQQSVGIIFVLGYSTYFFQLAGLEESSSFDLGVGVTACGVVGNLLSWFVINSFGRRKVFLIGMFSITTLLMIIGIMDVIASSAAKWVQAACTVIYALIYSATIGAMAFAILGETCAVTLKAKTIALATATQAVTSLAMSFAIPYMVNPDEANLKGKVGFIFGGLAFLTSVWSWVYIPELKGRRYDEIDRMFQEKVKPRHMSSYKL